MAQKRPNKNINLSIWLGVFLVSILMLSPLLLGSNRSWAWGIILIANGVLVAILGILQAFQIRPLLGITFPLKRITLLYTLVLIWGFLQTIVPGHTELWSQASQALGRDLASTLSLDVSETYDGLWRYVMYGTLGWCVWQINSTLPRWWLLDKLILFSGGFGLLSLILFLLFPEVLFGITKMYSDDLTGTFLNRNHAAAFLGIGFLLTTARLMHVMIHPRMPKMTWSLIIDRAVFQGGKYIIVLIILLVALMLTHSRAGILSVGLGLTTLVATSAIVPAWSHVRSLLKVPAIAVVCIGLIASVGLSTRWDTLVKDSGLRHAIYETTLTGIKERPLTGYSLGNYVQAIEHVHDERLAFLTGKQIDHTHNTLLENMFELGIPAAVLLTVVWLLLLHTAWLRAYVAEHPAAPLAALAMGVQLSAHSLLDFPLEIPAITVWFVTIVVSTLPSREVLPPAPEQQNRQSFKGLADEPKHEMNHEV